MKDILKNSAKVLGIKLAVSFIFIAFILSFTWLFKFSAGYMIYSGAISVILIGWLFSVFKSEGKKLSSKERGALHGLICGGLCECISLLILVLMLLFKNAFGAFNIAYWVLNAPLSGFFRADAKLFLMTGITPGYVLPVIIVPAVCGIGCYLGYIKYEFKGKLLERLVYKEEKGEENGK